MSHDPRLDRFLDAAFAGRLDRREVRTPGTAQGVVAHTRLDPLNETGLVAGNGKKAETVLEEAMTRLVESGPLRRPQNGFEALSNGRYEFIIGIDVWLARR